MRSAVKSRADIFSVGQVVDVQGTTKGKGFGARSSAGTSPWATPRTGNSLSHRSPGSLGQRQTPGRVYPGKKMAGHMGAETQTTQNLKVMKVDAERGLIAIRGAFPVRPAAT